MLEEFDPFELALPFGGSGSQELASCELFSVALAKLIFNFLSLIRHGSSYGSLLAYTPTLSWFYCPRGRAYTVLHCFAAVLYCHSKHGAFFLIPSRFSVSLFPRSCPFPPSTFWLRQRPTYAWAPHGHFQLLGVPTWRINNRETNNPETPSSRLCRFYETFSIHVVRAARCCVARKPGAF